MNDGHHLGFKPDRNPPHLRRAVCDGGCAWSVPAPGTGYARGGQLHRQHLADVLGPHYAVIVVAPGASRVECAGCTWTGPNGDAHDQHRADLLVMQVPKETI